VSTTRPGSTAATIGLVAVALAFFIQAYDVAGMGLALNRIGDDLHRGIETTQWVVNALALGYAVTIVLGGRLSDMFGAGPLLATGLCVFALGSSISATAPNIELLIAGRAVSGLGVGIMWPAGLAFAYMLVSSARAAVVGGMCVGAIAAGNAAGPILAGLLVDGPGWRWVLVVNIPVSLAAVWFVLRARALNPESRVEEGSRHLNYAGAAMLGLSLVALLVALDHTGGEHGGALVFYAAAAAALVAFIAVERGRGPGSLVPPELFRQRNFLFSCLAIAAIAPAFWTSLVYLPLLAQRGLGYSATLAGVAMLPMMLPFMIASFLSGGWYAALGAKLLLSIGAGAIAAGAVVLTLTQHPPAYLQLAVGMASIGLGIGVFFSSLTTVAALSVRTSLRGVAMGVLYTAEIIGGAIGLAAATAIFSRSDTGATASSALVDSFRHVFMLVAITAVVGLAISLTLVTAPESEPAATESA
jgi:MFS family permease